MSRFLHVSAIWVLILGLAGLYTHDWQKAPKEAIAEEAANKVGATHDAQTSERIDAVAEIRGRLLVVAASLSNAQSALKPEDLVLGDAPLDRLASAIVLVNAGLTVEANAQIQLASDEFTSADAVANRLLVQATQIVVNAWPAVAAQKKSAEPLEKSVQDTFAPLPTKEQFELLKENLGWFGEFAQAKLGGDEKLMSALQVKDVSFLFIISLAGVWFVGIGLCGFVALIVLSVLALYKKISSGFAIRPNTAIILGETFVVWFVLFLVLHFLAALLPIDEDSQMRLVLSGALMFVSLTALSWAVVRGLTLSNICDSIGFRWNGGLLSFIWKSGISYATALPLMGLGLLLGMAMGWFLGVPNLGNPTHPIQEKIINANPTELLLLFALACIAAPIVEEIIFRGVLYGHVRQGTNKWGVLASMIFSMVISGTIFASIHPQGMFIAPALAGLACGFCITREWTGSVFPGMVAHAMQNATVLALNVFLFHA